MVTVTVHQRAGCHLCEEAVALLRRVQARHDFILETVDIEAEHDLHRRYLERIPVVSVDGAEVYEFFVDEEDLLERLRAIESSAG